MKRLLAAASAAFLLCATHGAQAQTGIPVVVASCSTAQGTTIGHGGAFTVDTDGNLCTGGSFSSTISGFTAAALGTPFTATEAGATGTLPAGAVVVVSNVGAVGAFCNLGGTPGQTGQYISASGGWFAFTVGVSTQVSCETVSGSGNTTINMVGGAGIPTGTGGGSGGGGGGGGAVTLATGAVAAGAYVPGSVLDGAIVGIGALADAAWVSGSGSVIALLKNVAAVSATTNTNLGTPGATTCATDTGSCSLNALLQRIAQRITTLIGSTLTINLPTNASQETGGNLASIASSNTTINTSATSIASSNTTIATNTGTTNTDLGPPGATACATDTGSCSVNALLQRVAQRLTSAIAGTAVTVASGADVVEGTVADAAYAGSGNATVVAALKGIYDAVTSGGGGGPVTIADGADVAQGAVADAAYTGSGSATVVAALKGIYSAIANNLLPTGTAGTPSTTVLTVQGISGMQPFDALLQAGSALIGKVGIDQTTPGTTNAISLSQVNGVTALAGAGASGTGAQRVTASQDTSTIAGSAPGVAGTASANVVTVQGVASMTKLLVTPDANSAVNVAQVNGVTTLAGAGATGTGSQRVTAAQDTGTIAGSAPGTAGVPSTNVVTTQLPTANIVQGVTGAMTGTASTSIIALVTSKRIVVTHWACTNSHATVGTFVLLQDGNGGTTLYEGYAAAVGGGFSFTIPDGVVNTSGNAIYVADVTTGANVICSASGHSAT